MSTEALVTKPASGLWTDAYPELVAAPSHLRTAFRGVLREGTRARLQEDLALYGRVERVPRSGSYFTREMTFLNTSIIIVRGKDKVIRAFHNICPHRGNKILGATTRLRK